MLTTLFVPRTIPFEGVLLLIIALSAIISLIPVKKSKTTMLLLAFFGCAALLGLSRILEGTVGGLLFIQLQDTFIILSGVFLIQFAYHFPENDQPREARLVLGIYILFLLVALGTILGLAIEATRYPDNLITSPEYFWYLNPLAIILAVFLCLRRALYYAGPVKESAAGWRSCLGHALKAIWQPPNKHAAIQRNLALALIIGMIQALPSLGLVTGLWAIYLIAIGGLLVLASIALVFYNHTSETISFNTKLVGISITALLIFMGIAGIHAIETIRLHQLESVTRQFQTVQEAIVRRTELEDAPPLAASYIISWPAPTDYPLANLDIHYLGDNVQQNDLNSIQGLGGSVNAIKVQDGFVSRFAGIQFRDFYRHRFEHDGRVYEIGFPWIEYAQLILGEVNQYILLTILGSLAILILFPFFFRRHLFDPLDNLLRGLKNADQDQLDSSLSVFYEDEIGTITRSFNRMMASLRHSNERRDQYEAELYITNTALNQEIQEREKAQLALRESEKKYRTVVEEATQGILVIQDDHRTFYNPTWLEMTGYSAEEYDSKSFLSLVFADDLEIVENEYQKLIMGHEFEVVPDFRITTKSGDIKWLSVRGARIEWEGKPAGMVFIKDITDRKDIERALNESELKYRTVVEQAAEGIVVVQDFKYVFYNSAFRDMTGYSEEEFESMQFMTFIHPDDVGMISEGFHTLLLRRDANVFSEFRVITKSGDTKWLSVHGTYIEWNGRPAGMVYAEDVTERKEQEQQIQSYQQQLQALASQLTLTEERERRRLAVELHDHIGQALALARIQIAAAQSSQLEATRNALLAETSEILKEAIQETRTLVFDLSSPVLNELGLSAAISEWLQKYAGKQAGLKSELVEIGPDFPMSVDLRAILYRSVRELLTNVIRHAQASYVRVTLEQSRSQACITVQDDGIGFQADDISARLSHSSGFGLFSIQEQINDLGGNLTIQTTPGEGTKITVCVPHHDL